MIRAGQCKLLFIDSGAHGLFNEHIIRKKHKTKASMYDWYTTKEYWEYVDRYADFIKAYENKVDVFANVDVIFNPELTWKTQEYMEKVHNLTPLPVVHYGTELKWLHKYLAKGYTNIALGGLGQDCSKQQYVEWADSCFNIICDQPSRLPKVKVHGFAVTSYILMVRYPWYSVDSTTWIMHGGYGKIIFPPWRPSKQEWAYDIPFLVIRLSARPSVTASILSMLNTHREREKEVFIKYITERGFKLGDAVWENDKEVILETGLCNNEPLRLELNAMYFIDLVEHLPQWPWAFYKGMSSNYLIQ